MLFAQGDEEVWMPIIRTIHRALLEPRDPEEADREPLQSRAEGVVKKLAASHPHTPAPELESPMLLWMIRDLLVEVANSAGAVEGLTEETSGGLMDFPPAAMAKIAVMIYLSSELVGEVAEGGGGDEHAIEGGSGTA
jgi:hypothetical protein